MISFGAPHEASYGWMQFVAAILASASWPLAVFALAFLFRTELKELIRRLKRGKFAGVEIDLEQTEAELERFERQVAEAPRPDPQIAMDEMPRALSPSVMQQDSERKARLLVLTFTNPSLAIEEMWRAVEIEVSILAQRKGIDPEDITTNDTFAVARILKRGEILTNQLMAMVAQLRKTRNEAVHDKGIDTTAAVRYLNLAERFIDAVRRV